MPSTVFYDKVRKIKDFPLVVRLILWYALLIKVGFYAYLYMDFRISPYFCQESITR